MAEGDTILRVAARIESALDGQKLRVRAGNGRGKITGVERLDGHRLTRVETRGKNLLLHFGELVLHCHLGMSGSWQVCRQGEPWRKQASTAWVALRGETMEAVQFGGPTLRVLTASGLRREPTLARLGPDILAPEFDSARAIRALRASPDREIGHALLDQHLIAGIGNIFKSEACFAAKASPWRAVGKHSDDELREILGSAQRLMQESVAKGRPDPAVYRRTGHPCPTCGRPIKARGQGEANRRTWWCPRCQPEH
jgi:endonuclease-8